MSVYMGETPRCFWTYFAELESAKEWDAYISHVQRVLCEAPLGSVLLDIAASNQMPNATQRGQLAAVLKACPVARTKRQYHAFVTSSRVTRGIVTAINWLQSSPFVEKVFPDAIVAAEWLRRELPDFDMPAACADLLAVVPDEILTRHQRQFQLVEVAERG